MHVCSCAVQAWICFISEQRWVQFLAPAHCAFTAAGAPRGAPTTPFQCAATLVCSSCRPLSHAAAEATRFPVWDRSMCRGCGRCINMCPVEALNAPTWQTARRTKHRFSEAILRSGPNNYSRLKLVGRMISPAGKAGTFKVRFTRGDLSRLPWTARRCAGCLATLCV